MSVELQKKDTVATEPVVEKATEESKAAPAVVESDKKAEEKVLAPPAVVADSAVDDSKKPEVVAGAPVDADEEEEPANEVTAQTAADETAPEEVAGAAVESKKRKLDEITKGDADTNEAEVEKPDSEKRAKAVVKEPVAAAEAK